jgi:hypothetical protein
MTVGELIEVLEGFDRTAGVTVSTEPGVSLEVRGHTAVLEHDGGELCAPCEVRLLAGDVWDQVDLDRTGWAAV